MSSDVLGLVLGGVGVLVSVGIPIWQALSQRARRRRRKAKKLKAELKAAKRRVAEFEARAKSKKE